MTITLHSGDNRDSLRRLIDQGVRVHSVVTDPPYGLVSVQKRFGKDGAASARTEGNDGSFARLSAGFMGKAWDGTGIERDPEFWKLIYDVLLPGGYVFAFSGSRTGHWQACAMEMAGFIMHPMHGWVFGCMDTETECLTRRGWLSYTDLLPTDEVLQWDSTTDTLSWVIPTHVHEYDFDGQMVQIKNRHTHQVLTPNHRVYAKVRRHSRHPKPTDYEVVEAREVHNRPGNWQVDLPMASMLYQSECVVDPAFAYLVGWWLTDAWPHKDANACCFSQSKPAMRVKLRAALEGLGASEYVKPAKKDTHNDEHTFYLTGPMADRLRDEFPDRVLGWHVLGWSLAARRALYEGLMDGDGSRNKPGQIAEAFWSQKQERRDVFLALALSIGIRCYEDHVKGAVYVNPKTRTTQVQGKQRADLLPYKGKVWCLTVPTGAFVVRRSGRPFITGNSGFPKAHNAAMAIDKMAGAPHRAKSFNMKGKEDNPRADEFAENGREILPPWSPLTPEAQQWDGWAYGTQAQKPALEPIYLGQKPFSEKTGAANLLKHGVGAVNIDGCRVPTNSEVDDPRLGGRGTWGTENAAKNVYEGGYAGVRVTSSPLGRHPANLILDGSPEVIAMFPNTKSGKPGIMRKGTNDGACYGAESRAPGTPMTGFGDEGSAARFFHQFPQFICETCCDEGWIAEGHTMENPYGEQVRCPDCDGLCTERPVTNPLFYHAKAGKSDRAGSVHPTVKPVALMQYLIRHITPPGGTVLDPFAGSGTTAEAARREGFDCILMEAEPEYIDFLRQRFADDLSTPRLNQSVRKPLIDVSDLF